MQKISKLIAALLMMILAGIFFHDAQAQNAGPFAGMSGLPADPTFNTGTFKNTITSSMNDGGIVFQTTQPTQPIKLMSAVSNVGTSVGYVFDTVNSVVALGSKLMSYRNQGAEVASLGNDGAFRAPAYYANNGFFTTLNTNVTVSLSGAATDSSSAVGTVLNTSPTLSTTGAKITSIRNNNLEKAYFDKDGNLLFKNSSIGIGWDGFGSNLPIIYYNGANQILFNVGNAVLANGYSQPNAGAPLILRSLRTNASTAIGTQADTNVAFTTAGAKLFQVANATVEKFYVDKDGSHLSVFTTLQTCAAGIEGLISLDAASGISTAARTRMCLCTSNGSAVYAWQNIVSGTVGTTTTCSP